MVAFSQILEYTLSNILIITGDKKMKTIAGFIIFSLAVLLGSYLWGVPIEPVSFIEGDTTMNLVVTVLLVALVSVIVGTLEILGLIALAGMIGLMARDKTVFYIALIVLVLSVFFIHPFVLDKVVQPMFEWFPNFTYWQFFAISLVSSLLQTESSSNKKNK